MKESQLKTFLTQDEARVFDSLEAAVTKQLVRLREKLIAGGEVEIKIGPNVPLAAVRAIVDHFERDGWIVTHENNTIKIWKRTWLRTFQNMFRRS